MNSRIKVMPKKMLKAMGYKEGKESVMEQKKDKRFGMTEKKEKRGR